MQKISITFSKKIGYSVGNLGFGIVYQAILSYLVFYATVILKVPGAIIGSIVAAGVIWDAVTDPVMGFISDNTVSKKFGRRHLYILAGGAGTAVFNAFLWAIDADAALGFKIAWLAVALLFVKTFQTVYVTPYTALSAELSADYDERSSIQATRTIFFLLGIFTVSFLFLLVFFKAIPGYPQGQLNPDAYFPMGLTASAFILIASVVVYYSTRSCIPILAEANETRLRHNVTEAGLTGKTNILSKVAGDFKIALKNKNYMHIVTGYMFTNIVSALASSLGLYVYTYTFGLGSRTIALIMGTQFFASIVSQPVWVFISKKIDKKQSVLIGLYTCFISCGLLLVLVLTRSAVGGNTVLLIFILSFFLGLGTGGLFSLPLSMIADTIDIEEYTTGKRSEGIFYGILTFSYKLTQSIIILILGILLQVIGFDPNTPLQSVPTSTWLGVILTCGSMASLVFAIAGYSRYRPNRSYVMDIQEKLAVASSKMYNE